MDTSSLEQYGSGWDCSTNLFHWLGEENSFLSETEIETIASAKMCNKELYDKMGRIRFIIRLNVLWKEYWTDHAHSAGSLLD